MSPEENKATDRELFARFTASDFAGNFVAVEVESKGDLQNGTACRQEYHMLVELRDGV